MNAASDPVASLERATMRRVTLRLLPFLMGAISLVGWIKESTGSFSMALLPMVLLTLAGGISVLVMTRRSRTQAVAAATPA